LRLLISLGCWWLGEDWTVLVCLFFFLLLGAWIVFGVLFVLFLVLFLVTVVTRLVVVF
jgi:hypothetical protein